MKHHDIKTVLIDECHPNKYNANRMPEAKFEALVDTIRRRGQTHPIQVVTDKKGGYRIVGGEHKWRAMKALKYKEVQIIEHAFEDEVEEQLGSLEDNLHGNPIPVKEAMIIHSATKKYKLPQLRKRLGEDESELKDKLLLVKDEEKLKKVIEDATKEHLVEVDFIVDADPKQNADNFVKDIVTYAKSLGAMMLPNRPPVIKLSKNREAVALFAFNISESQKNVVEQAIKMITKEEDISRGRALELMSADFLAGHGLSPARLAKAGKKQK